LRKKIAMHNDSHNEDLESLLAELTGYLRKHLESPTVDGIMLFLGDTEADGIRLMGTPEFSNRMRILMPRLFQALDLADTPPRGNPRDN